MHLLSEIKGNEKIAHATKFTAHISPMPDYDLPKTQLSFKLILENRSTTPKKIANPLQTLQLLFTTRESKVIEIPVRPPPSLIHSVPPKNTHPAPIVFVSSQLNGEKNKIESESYLLTPDSSLEIVFECEKVVGDRIVTALSKDAQKENSVFVLFTLSLIDLKNPEQSVVLRSEEIKLGMPKSGRITELE